MLELPPRTGTHRAQKGTLRLRLNGRQLIHLEICRTDSRNSTPDLSLQRALTPLEKTGTGQMCSEMTAGEATLATCLTRV